MELGYSPRSSVDYRAALSESQLIMPSIASSIRKLILISLIALVSFTVKSVDCKAFHLNVPGSLNSVRSSNAYFVAFLQGENEEGKKSNPEDAKFFLGLLLLVSLLICAFSPGMLIMSIIKCAFSLNLDRGQMWTFSVLLSIGMIGVIELVAVKLGLDTVENSLTVGIGLYAVICVFILCSFLVAYFGFKIKFIRKAFSFFFPIEEE
jgi:hypothetical protein